MSKNFKDLYSTLDEYKHLYDNEDQVEIENYFTIIEKNNPNTYATYVIAILCTILYLLLASTSNSYFDFNTEELTKFGANYAPLTFSGEYWRLFTSMFLHGSLIHFALNMQALFVLGNQLEKIYGTKFFIVLYCLSGLLGSIVSIIFNPSIVSIGASGAIFGLATAYGIYFVFPSYKMPRKISNELLISIGIFIAYNIYYGLISKNIDNGAHLGGALGGIIFGFLLARPITEEIKYKENIKLLTRGLIGCLIIIFAYFGAHEFTEKYNLKYKNAISQYYYSKGFTAYENKEFDTAINILIKSAQFGNVSSQYLLGYIYLNYKKDITTAINWLEQSANSGHNPAISLLGQIYFYEDFKVKNYKKAFDYFMKSNTDPESEYHLGNMYFFGYSVIKNSAEAIKWLTKASEHGIKRSDGLLGAYYFDGIGVQQSYPKAFQYFKNASKEDNDYAQFQLSRMYFEGLGVNKNISKAILWLNISNENGNQKSTELLKNFKQDPILKKLIDDSIIVAKDCIAKKYENCD